MLDQHKGYPPNGSADTTTRVVLPQPGSVRELMARLGLTEQAQQELVETFRRAVVRVVDDVVGNRQTQAIVGYYVLRRLDGDTWWKR
jgi:hypothetical protein